MFRFANRDDTESLFNLWHECFGDEKDFVMPFLDTFLKEDNVYIFENEGKAVSAVYALDCKIGDEKAIYFYAVATSADFRKKGLAGREIEFLIDYKKKQGCKIFLLTASSEKNKNYYQKLGFRSAFYCTQKLFKITENKSEITETQSKKDVLFLRENHFESGKYVSFGENHLAFAMRFSDKVFCEKQNGKTVSFALCDEDKIIEAVSDGNIDSFVSSVLQSMGKTEAQIYMPLSENTASDSCKISRGMVYCLDNKNLENICENIFLSLNLE